MCTNLVLHWVHFDMLQLSYHHLISYLLFDWIYLVLMAVPPWLNQSHQSESYRLLLCIDFLV